MFGHVNLLGIETQHVPNNLIQNCTEEGQERKAGKEMGGQHHRVDRKGVE